jgi:hypothetical protein
MDPVVYTLFKKEEIVKIQDKLKKMLLNTGTHGKSQYTLFEMFAFKSELGVVHDLFSVFNIFVSEDIFLNAMSNFIHLNNKTVNQTVFEYKNMKLIKNEDKCTCERYLDEERIIGDGILNVLTQIKLEDSSKFSCRDDIKQRGLVETRFKVAEKAPVYLSFIHDTLIDRFYYKLWFDIADDIDDVLECFN